MTDRGHQFTCSVPEIFFLLFKKKKCPKCGATLTRRKDFKMVYGNRTLRSQKSGPGPDWKIRRYYYVFTCNKCGTEFTVPSGEK